MHAAGTSHVERAALLSDRIGAFQRAFEDDVDAVCAAVVAADYAAGEHNALTRPPLGEY